MTCISSPPVKPPDYICIVDEKPKDTEGGQATGGWDVRDLNVIRSDDGSHASLLDNEVTLVAGSYVFRARCPAKQANNHQCRLYNLSDAAVVEVGTSEFLSSAGDYTPTRSIVVGKFTIASSKTFVVQHRLNLVGAADDFGEHAGFGVEVYTIAEFRKVA